jgi:hypothetical protein
MNRRDFFTQSSLLQSPALFPLYLHMLLLRTKKSPEGTSPETSHLAASKDWFSALSAEPSSVRWTQFEAVSQGQEAMWIEESF